MTSVGFHTLMIAVDPTMNHTTNWEQLGILKKQCIFVSGKSEIHLTKKELGFMRF